MSHYQELDKSDGRIRQIERTVDNVKRLYAFAFSLSFTNIFREIAERYNAAPAGPGLREQDLKTHLCLLLIFVVTASVFYFQADRLLDLRYAPVPSLTNKEKVFLFQARRRDIAFSYLNLFVTMAPFIVMSFCFDQKVGAEREVHRFYEAFALQMTICNLPGAWLLLSWSLRRSATAGETRIEGRLSETARSVSLGTHWLILNCLTLLAVSIAAQWTCGSSFLMLFVVLAMLRNFADFFCVWQFLELTSEAPRRRALLPWWPLLIPAFARLFSDPADEARRRFAAKAGVGFALLLFATATGVAWTRLPACSPAYQACPATLLDFLGRLANG